MPTSSTETRRRPGWHRVVDQVSPATHLTSSDVLVNLSLVLKELRLLGDPDVVRGMKRFGLPTEKTFGITAPKLRSLAKRIGMNQDLSLKLWRTEILDARVLAAFIGNPKEVRRRQMERWVRDFDSWSVCDACCGILFVQTPYALYVAFKWAESEKEFVKRAGFVMMAEIALHLKALNDREFPPMLKAIQREAQDERNFVRKAVNWALRQIGKRNRHLNRLAIVTAEKIRAIDSRSARWIAADALRELNSKQVQRRLQKWELKRQAR
jgi:3-methyladenine DNA glycosylase AlkD